MASTEATLPASRGKDRPGGRSARSAHRHDAGELEAAASRAFRPQAPRGSASDASRRSSSGSAPTFSSPRPSCTRPTPSIGVATAAMLPNLTLSAGYGVNNASAGRSALGRESVLEPRSGADAAPVPRGRALLPAQGGNRRARRGGCRVPADGARSLPAGGRHASGPEPRRRCVDRPDRGRRDGGEGNAPDPGQLPGRDRAPTFRCSSRTSSTCRRRSATFRPSRSDCRTRWLSTSRWAGDGGTHVRLRTDSGARDA